MKIHLLFADLSLEIEADIDIVYFKREMFRKFLVFSEDRADIFVHYHEIDERLVVHSELSTEEELLIRNSRHIGMDSLLLGAQGVRQRLVECMAHPQLSTIELHPRSIVFYDYFAHRLDVYFAAQDSRELAERNVYASIVAPFLPAFSATVVHSSAIIRRGSTALFLAPDEGGKTTVVRSAPSGTILSDDQNIIRKKNGRVMVYGTPWGLFTNPQENAPLGGIFFLEQSAEFRLEAVASANALEYLYNDSRPYVDYLPRGHRIELFHLLDEVCHQVPCYRMYFPRDFIDWDAIDTVMG
ncbi:MAG: hypothetical protein JXB15_01360 [Anaerolineales bacterium]|nr:hypothetical protein [Anaerolineales bacterium]